MNNDEAGCSVPFSNNVGAENDNAYDNVHICDDRFDDVARDADSPVQVSQENIRDAPVVEAAHVGQCMSGETEVDPCSVGRTQSDQVYTGETEKIPSSSPDVSNQFKVLQGKIFVILLIVC